MQEPTALTTGFLNGVVHDEAVRPLASVEITIRSNATDVAILTTDADGRWGIGDLDPGTYIVHAVKPGFRSTNVSADVEAGVQTPEPVAIQLVRVPVDDAFVWPTLWEGVITCGTTIQNWCAATNFATGVDVFTDDSFKFLFDDFLAFERVPDFMQAEFVWTANTEASRWAYALSWASTWQEWEECLCSPDPFPIVEGDQHIVLQVTGEEMVARNVGIDTGIAVGFAAGSPEPTNHPDRTTVMAQQPFEAVLHVFYGCLPPDGWLFTVGGAPPCDPDTLDA